MPTKKLNKVLIVEDYISLLEDFVALLEGEYVVFGAKTIREAKNIIDENPDIQVIALDGELITDGKKETTFDFSQKMRKKFPNITIIAMSGRDDIRTKQMGSGCNAEVLRDKTEIIHIIRKLLPID